MVELSGQAHEQRVFATMCKVARGSLIGCLVALCGSAAAAQERQATDFDYDDLQSEVPIESEVFTPKLTYDSPGGNVFTFYGQVNLTYQSFDDGTETTSGLVDNGNWNTRIGFTYLQPLDELTLRYRFETGLGLRNSALVSQTFEPPWIDWQKTSLRWFEVAADARIGTFSFGQGSTASDGTAGLDDSFTFVAGATNSTDGFGSFRFRDADGNLTNVSIGQVNNAFNGTRRFRARYDTPIFNGVMLSTSYGRNILTDGDNADYYDLAIRWTGNIGDIEVRTAAGYQWIDDPDNGLTRRVAGSVTGVHVPTGLNLSVSAGQQINGASYYWARAGWQTDLIAAGTTYLSVDYYNGSDFLSDGARTENYGIYAVQDIDALSLNLYAGWRRFTYGDRLGNTYQDADGLLFGARWFF